MDKPTPEALIAEVRAALGTAAEVAVGVELKTKPAPAQMKDLGRRLVAAHDALNQIAVMLGLDAPSITPVTPPDPG